MEGGSRWKIQLYWASGFTRTKSMAALLEEIKKRLAHAESAPFVLLLDERHVCGLRVAVEGYIKRSCVGEEAGAVVHSGELSSPRLLACKMRKGSRQDSSASNPVVTQRGGYRSLQHSRQQTVGAPSCNQRPNGGLRGQAGQGRRPPSEDRQWPAGLLEASRKCARPLPPQTLRPSDRQTNPLYNHTKHAPISHQYRSLPDHPIDYCCYHYRRLSPALNPFPIPSGKLRCMAQVVAPGSPASTAHYAQQNAPRGTKRAADSSLENEQRLSKRFDLLNLGASCPTPSAACTEWVGVGE